MVVQGAEVEATLRHEVPKPTTSPERMTSLQRMTSLSA